MSEVPTISDVARRAGVSVATVSRALRDLPHVSQATRAKVKEIADELDYQANPHAVRLAAGRSGTVGVALPLVNSWFYGNILAGVESVLAEDKVDLHLTMVDSYQGMERFVAAIPSLRKQLDGLVVVDLFMPITLWEMLAASGLPVATIGVDTGILDAVMIDNISAARRVGEHLLGQGHRDLAFIGSAHDEALPFESSNLRFQGLVEALEAGGVDENTITSAPGGFTVDGGADAARVLVEHRPRPTAIFCASDEMAVGALWALRQQGLDVPGDISVVGFDDHVMAEAVGLTTVHQPVSELAARAAEIVMTRSETPDRPPVVEYLDAPLRVRESSGVAPQK